MRTVPLGLVALLLGCTRGPSPEPPASRTSELLAACASEVQGIGDVATGWIGLRTDGTMWVGTPARMVTELGSGVATLADTDGESLTFCARKSDGTLWCWGSNTGGQLGDGTTNDREAPYQVEELGASVAQVAVGGEHTCALTTDGTLWCWGRNAEGQLGDGTMLERRAPAQVTALGNGVARVSAGFDHTCALMTTGALSCWGGNTYNQVDPSSDLVKPSPVTVAALGTDVESISAGGFFNCVVKADHTLWCWGENHFGQAGVDPDTSPVPAPAQLGGAVASGVAWVDAGVHFTCALTTAGAAHCWGENAQGQLGNGTSTDSFSPVAVTNLASGGRSIHVVEGGACAVKTDDSVWCWGAGGFLDGQGPSNVAVEIDFCGLCAPSDCTGATPVCAMGQCSACTSDEECPQATPACQTSGACGTCNAENATACPSTAPACSAEGTCICTQDWDCGENPIGMACDDDTRQCRAGCRGGGEGTGCPAGSTCTSSSSTVIGECAPLDSGPGCACEAAGPRRAFPAGGCLALLALLGLALCRRRPTC